MTFVADRKTGDTMLQCDACPDTFVASDAGADAETARDPRALKQLAEREAGWSATKEAGAWSHYCGHCTNRRKGRLL